MQGHISEILEFLVRVTQEGFAENFNIILQNSWEYCVKEVLNVFFYSYHFEALLDNII